MSDWQSKTYTVSVPANTVNHNDDTSFGPSLFNILKIKVTQDLAGGTFNLRTYKDAAHTKKLISFPLTVAPLLQPRDRSAGDPGTEALEGRPFPYDDDDGTGQLHTQWDNNDSVDHIYTITVIYYELPLMSAAGAPTYRGSITAFSGAAIGATSTDGGVFANSTAAAAGAQQWSPRVRLTGQGWKTNATAASQPVDFIVENQTVQGSVNPSGNLVISSQVNSGGYTGWFSFSSAGIFSQSAAYAIGSTSTDGHVLSNTTAAINGGQQFSPRIRLTGQGWKTTATAATQTVDWIVENQPVQGTANPTTNFVVSYQVNAGGYSRFFSAISATPAFDLASGISYSINGTSVLSATVLGIGVVTSSLTAVGTIATGVWQATAVAAGYGGTGLSTYAVGDLIYASATTPTLSRLADVAAGSYLRSGGVSAAPLWSTLTLPNAATTGDVFVATGTNAVGVVAVQATANKVLMSGASAVPTWSTPTFPNASATSGKFIISDGTNWIASTPTVPNAATGTGTILRADGTNWAATTATYPATTTVSQILYSSSTNVIGGLATANNAFLTTDGSGIPSVSTTGVGQVARIGYGAAADGTAQVNINGVKLYSDGTNLGINVTTVSSLLSTTATAQGDGGTNVAAAGLTWTANAAGYVAGFVNADNAAQANGLFVKIAYTSPNAQVVDFRSGSNVQRFAVRADGAIQIGTSNADTNINMGALFSQSGVGFDNTATASGRKWYLGDGTSTAAGTMSLYDVTGSKIIWSSTGSGTFFLPNITNANAQDYMCYNTGTKEVEQNATVCNLSTEAAKNSIFPLGAGLLAKVMQLAPISFVLDAHPELGRRIGFSAEQAEPIDGRLVTYFKDGKTLRSFDYMGYVAMLTGAVQELKDEVDNLRAVLSLPNFESKIGSPIQIGFPAPSFSVEMMN